MPRATCGPAVGAPATGSDHGLAPSSLKLRTRTWWVRSLFRRVNVTLVSPRLSSSSPSCQSPASPLRCVTSYPVTGGLPASSGAAFQLTSSALLRGVTATPSGGAGGLVHVGHVYAHPNRGAAPLPVTDPHG